MYIAAVAEEQHLKYWNMVWKRKRTQILTLLRSEWSCNCNLFVSPTEHLESAQELVEHVANLKFAVCNISGAATKKWDDCSTSQVVSSKEY